MLLGSPPGEGKEGGFGHGDAGLKPTLKGDFSFKAEVALQGRPGFRQGACIVLGHRQAVAMG